MEEILRFSWQIFLLIMLLTSWRQLIKIGVAIMTRIGSVITDWLEPRRKKR